MSKWSEGADILQKLITAKEVIPVQGDLINLQQTMFTLQAEQMKLIDENLKVKRKIEKLEGKKKYVYDVPHNWLIDSDKPDLKLCPVCLNRDNFENPLFNGYSTEGQYCEICKINVK